MFSSSRPSISGNAACFGRTLGISLIVDVSRLIRSLDALRKLHEVLGKGRENMYRIASHRIMSHRIEPIDLVQLQTPTCIACYDVPSMSHLGRCKILELVSGLGPPSLRNLLTGL